MAIAALCSKRTKSAAMSGVFASVTASIILWVSFSAFGTNESHALMPVAAEGQHDTFVGNKAFWPIGRHDPMSQRIARANERPENPVPALHYLIVIFLVLGLGGGVGAVLAYIATPKKRDEK